MERPIAVLNYLEFLCYMEKYVFKLKIMWYWVFVYLLKVLFIYFLNILMRRI